MVRPPNGDATADLWEAAEGKIRRNLLVGLTKFDSVVHDVHKAGGGKVFARDRPQLGMLGQMPADPRRVARCGRLVERDVDREAEDVALPLI